MRKAQQKKKRKKKKKRLQSQMKISKPKGHLQLTVISSTLLALPCHINHISHATLCPLMSMPDICHGPWPMSYYLHNNPPSLYSTTDQGVSLSLLLPLFHHTLCCLSQRRSSQTKIKLVYLFFGATSTGRGFRQHMFEYFMRNTRQILSRDVHNMYK